MGDTGRYRAEQGGTGRYSTGKHNAKDTAPAERILADFNVEMTAPTTRSRRLPAHSLSLIHI